MFSFVVCFVFVFHLLAIHESKKVTLNPIDLTFHSFRTNKLVMLFLKGRSSNDIAKKSHSLPSCSKGGCDNVLLFLRYMYIAYPFGLKG